MLSKINLTNIHCFKTYKYQSSTSQDEAGKLSNHRHDWKCIQSHYLRDVQNFPVFHQSGPQSSRVFDQR